MEGMRLLWGMDAGGGWMREGDVPFPIQSVEVLAKFISKECKNSFSTAYLLITFAVLHK